MLKAQLAKIAQNNALSSKLPGKQVPSVLFSPREASDTELDTIHAIAINGLKSLVEIDSRLSRFHKTLFSNDSKSFNRAFKTTQENKTLDMEIHDFFLLLQPHVLLRSSLKCVEWLLRRFLVHQFNSEDFIGCFLPYCDDEVFERVLNVVELKGQWAFLHAYRGLPTNMSIIVKQSFKDPSVVWFASEMLAECFKHLKNPALIKIRCAFYLSLIVPFLKSTTIDENILLKILPLVLECLKSQAASDMQVCAYLVIAQLCDLTIFSAEVCSVLCNAVVMTSYSMKNSLFCLAKIYQTQENASLLTSSALDMIFEQNDIFELFVQLQNSYDIWNMVEFVVKSLLKNLDNRYLHILSDLLATLAIDETVKVEICKHLASTTDEALDSKLSSKILQRLNFIPEAVDFVHGQDNLFASVDTEDLVKTSMFLRLRSSNTKHRVEASVIFFKNLPSVIENLQVDILESLRFMVASCLDDDANDVLSVVFSCPFLPLYVQKSALVEKLTRILNSDSIILSNRLSAGKLVIDLMDSPADESCLGTLVSYLFESDFDPSIDLSKSICSYFVKKHGHGLSDNSCSNIKIAKIVGHVASDEYLVSLIQKDGNTRNLAVACLLSKPHLAISLQRDLLKTIKKQVNPCSTSHEIQTKFLGGQLEDPSPAILSHLLQLASHVVPHFFKELSSDDLKEQVDITKLLFTKLVQNKEFLLLKEWVENMDPITFMQFSSSFWIEEIEEDVAVYALKLVKSKLKKTASVICFYPILCGLTSIHQAVRQLSLDCLKVLNKGAFPSEVSFAPLLIEELMKHKTEIGGDPDAFVKIFSKFLSKDKKVKKSFVDGIISEIKLQTSPLYRISLFKLVKSEGRAISGLGDVLLQKMCEMKKKPLDANVLAFVCEIFSAFNPKMMSRFKGSLRSSFFTALDILESTATWLGDLPFAVYNVINQEFYQALIDESDKIELPVRLFRLSSSIRPHNASPRKIILSLNLNYTIFLDEIARLLLKFDNDEGESLNAKKTKEDRQDETELQFLLSIDPILEVLKAKKDISHSYKLAPILFELLTFLLTSDSGKILRTSDYSTQLTLSVILDLIENCPPTNFHELDETSIRVDVLVQCIRGVSSSETRNLSILVVSALCRPFPEKVLCNIMPVFTFMGSTMLQKDDATSFDITAKLIQKVVPKMSEKGSTVEIPQLVQSLLAVFCDAFFHIPEHRRVHLFSVLLNSLNSPEYLGIISLMLLSRANKSYQSSEKFLMDFICTLFMKFDVKTRMVGLVKVLTVVSTLSNPKFMVDSASQTDPEDLKLLNLRKLKQKLHFRATAVEFLVHFCESAECVSVIPGESEEDHGLVEFMEATLKCINAITSSPDIANSNSNLVDSLCICIEKVLGKCDLQSVTKLLQSLLKNTDSKIRHRSLGILKFRLEQFNEESKDARCLLEITDSISVIICTEVETISNKQLAISCLEKLCQANGVYKHELLIYCFEHVMKLNDSNTELLGPITSCSNVFVRKLGPRCLPYLQQMFNFASCAVYNKASKSAVHSGLNLCIRLVQDLSQFLTPFIENILRIVIVFSGKEDTAVIAAKLGDVISSTVQPRHLLPAIYKTFSSSKSEGDLLSPLVSVLRGSIKKMNKEAVISFYKAVFKFILELFDFCVEIGADAVEKNVIETVFELTLKLNENLFRPLYLKLVDWATSTVSLTGTQETSSNIIKGRKTVLFRLTNHLIGQLMSIFAPYFTYLLDATVNILNEAVEKHTTSDLWIEAIGAMSKFLKYDLDSLLSTDKCVSILPSIVNQLLLVTDDPSILSNIIVPCIVNLGNVVVTKKEDSLLKQLNHQVLMKTRDETAKVRVNALMAIQELYNAIGDELLVHLPETVPFLSELLEDDDEDVDIETKKTIKIIESYLGESLQEHLR